MDRSVIQIRINDPLRITRPAGFASRCLWNQFVKQFAQDCTVMGQVIRNNQGLALIQQACSGSHTHSFGCVVDDLSDLFGR